jgi:hypothetical protein
MGRELFELGIIVWSIFGAWVIGRAIYEAWKDSRHE